MSGCLITNEHASRWRQTCFPRKEAAGWTFRVLMEKNCPTRTVFIESMFPIRHTIRKETNQHQSINHLSPFWHAIQSPLIIKEELKDEIASDEEGKETYGGNEWESIGLRSHMNRWLNPKSGKLHETAVNTKHRVWRGEKRQTLFTGEKGEDTEAKTVCWWRHRRRRSKPMRGLTNGERATAKTPQNDSLSLKDFEVRRERDL